MPPNPGSTQQQLAARFIMVADIGLDAIIVRATLIQWTERSLDDFEVSSLIIFAN